MHFVYKVSVAASAKYSSILPNIPLQYVYKYIFIYIYFHNYFMMLGAAWVEFAQLGMALVKRQGGFREIEAMLTHPPPCQCREEEEEEGEEGAPLAENWTVVNIRNTVSLQRSC